MPLSITAVMPVRNGSTFLMQSIECIWSQQYSPLELVIVDDGSSDGSLELARASGARVLQTPSVGPAAARNEGICASQSDLIAFLDADDLWPPETLHRLSRALETNPGADFAQGLIRNFREQDGAPRFFTPPYRFINLGASLYRRALFDRIGLLDVTLRLCEDLDFFMRCWERDIERVTVDEVTLNYRRHPGNMTAGLHGVGTGTVQAFKRRIDRIRRGLYDPSQPKQIHPNDYMGIGPERQDKEVTL